MRIEEGEAKFTISSFLFFTASLIEVGLVDCKYFCVQDCTNVGQTSGGLPPNMLCGT